MTIARASRFPAVDARSLRRLGALLCVGLTVGGAPGRADACRCIEQKVEDAVAEADAIFAGKVASLGHVGDPGSGQVYVTFNLDTVWKGPIQATLFVTTADSSAACGFLFEEGLRYIVYGQETYSTSYDCEIPSEPFLTTTCTRTRPFSLEEAAKIEALLGDPRWGASQPFLRGEVNGDGRWDLSDMVYLLSHLFLGGPGVACNDAMDVNDDGKLDISDGVYGLSWLALGGPPPPAPGPFSPGFDPTTSDPFPCGDASPLSCKTAANSDLPDVRIELLDAPCALSLAEAAAGVAITYRVVVESPRRVVTRPLGTCQSPTSSGLFLQGSFDGSGQHYCLCDLGFCPPADQEVDLAPGSYLETFLWCGRNWYGPSDTVNAPGDPFPPGTYRFEVRGEGTYAADEAHPAEPFSLSASYELELVP